MSDLRCTLQYAAGSYLDEWLREDCRFREKLAIDKRNEISDDQAVKCLAEMATYYRVIRGFPDIAEEPRLLEAYRILSSEQPVTEANRVRAVTSLAEKLGKAYKGARANAPQLLSAASKFLWMRFGSPVLIYDSTVSNYLGFWEYEKYCDAWVSEFTKYNGQVTQACDELISYKQFTLASDLTDEQLRSWTSNGWFHERVFDHYMQIEYDLRNRSDTSKSS